MPVAVVTTAVDREAGWLTAVDPTGVLPSLLSANGGPFQTVSAYQPRTPRVQQRAVYVARRSLRSERTAFGRRMTTHTFVLSVLWPMSTSTTPAESAQRSLDMAVDQVLSRIKDLSGDHTHGGAFLSAAENPDLIDVQFGSAATAIAGGEPFDAQITFTADDFEEQV